MSSEKITIKEVAKKAKVSIATVSRFLNKPASLKEFNRKKVEKAIGELNYRPLIYARRLAGGKLNSFGLIMPGYEGIFYSFYALEIIREVAVSLDKKNIDLHLHLFWSKDNFKSSLVDGVLLADIKGNDRQLRRLVREDLPVVVINKKIDDLELSYVAIDNFKGGYEATEFLIHHGHKKVAHLSGDSAVQCSEFRLDGYKAALEKNGIAFRDEYVKATNFSRRDTRDAMEQLFSLQDHPTAVFCCSDEVASEVLNFCEERNIEVPKDLSVIGFDDDPHCMYGNLMLTTVRQPLKKMAAIGVELLKDLVDGKSENKKISLDTELVIRDTVAFRG